MKLPGNLKISIEKSPPVRPVSLSPVVEIEPLILDTPASHPHDDLDIPQFMEKDSPVVSDIFQKPSPKKPRPPPIIQVVKDDTKKRKLTKKGKVRKEMTEEQKEKARENLRIAREKRALKQQGKQPKQVSFKTEMEDTPPPPPPQPSPSPAPAPAPSPAPAPPPPVSLFSKDDLEQSNLQAIIQYETLRKKRKEIKKNNKIVEDERQRVIGVAQQHIGGWKATAGRFNGCY